MSDNTNIQNEVSVNNTDQLDISRLFAEFMRYSHFFLVAFCVVATLAIFPMLTQSPRYTSNASIMLDPRSYNDTPSKEVASGLPADTTQMDTEVEVLKSKDLATQVVKELELDKDPEFNPYIAAANNEKSGSVIRPAAPQAASAEAQTLQQQRIVNKVLSALSVKRQGLTRIINISFTSLSPQKSAKIVNKWTELYIKQQVAAKLNATMAANEILKGRLSELKVQVEASDKAVEDFKIRNGLLSAGGRNLNEQEISNYSQQVAQAKADVAQAAAKLNIAKSQRARNSRNEDVGEALNSPVVQNLRAIRADISRDFAKINSRYGPMHPEYIKAKAQLNDVDAQINSEINRIISNLEGQYSVQKQRLDSLSTSMNSAKDTLRANNAATVTLKQLETDAEAVRTLYESYLNRYKETAAEEGNAKPDSRVVAVADLPTAPSAPNVPVSILLGIVLGLIAGLASVLVSKLLDTAVYNAEDAERKLGVPHLASISSLKSTLKLFSNFKGSPVDYLRQKPLSLLAEGFRNLRASILYTKSGEKVRVISITSALPKEGKTTTSLCLANIIATSGQSVVLVDCDLRRHSLSDILVKKPAAGLLEYITGNVSLDDVIVKDKSGVAYLPLAGNSLTSKDIFGSSEMVEAIEKLKAQFDIVILDTAPVIPVAESRIVSRLADATVLLVRWSKTPSSVAKEALDLLKDAGVSVAGVSLTQANYNKINSYAYGGSSYYRSKSYTQYYSE